jgi:hypothetical protein
MAKLTGSVFSNDGEVAQVVLSNGARLHINRIDPLVDRRFTVEEFLEDLPVGELNPNWDIERMFVS